MLFPIIYAAESSFLDRSVDESFDQMRVARVCASKSHQASRTQQLRRIKIGSKQFCLIISPVAIYSKFQAFVAVSTTTNDFEAWFARKARNKPVESCKMIFDYQNSNVGIHIPGAIKFQTSKPILASLVSVSTSPKVS